MMSKKNLFDNPRNIVLRLLILVVLIICAYSIFTYGRIILTSDSATAVVLAESVWKNHSLFPKSWNYAQGDVWTFAGPFSFFSMILYPFMKGSDLSRVTASFLQLILSLIAVVLFYKKGLQSRGYLIAFPLATIFLYGNNFYLIYDACYGGYLFWLPVIVLLLIDLCCSEKTKVYKYIIFALVLFWHGAAGTRNVAEYILPILVTIFIMFAVINNEKNVTEIKQGALKWIGLFLLTLLSAGCGLGAYRYIAATRNINSRPGIMALPNDLADVGQGLLKTIRYIFYTFGYDGNVQMSTVEGLRSLVGIGICILVCFVVPIMQAFRLKEESNEVKILFTYTIVHNAILLACSIFFTFVTSYHLTSSIVLFVLVSANYIYNRFLENNGKLLCWVWIALFAVGCFVECACTYKHSYNWKEKLNETKRVAEVLEEHGLTKGYATFWNAYNNRMYSSFKVQISAVSIDDRLLQEYLYLNDSGDYDLDDSKSFLMFTDEEMEQDANWDVILYGYATPIEEFTIKDVYKNDWNGKSESRYNLNVFVYDEDYAQYLGNGLSDGIVSPLEMKFNYLGSKSLEKVMMNPGGLVYGPYARVENGKYLITYEGKNLSDCIPEIISEEKPDTVDYKIIEQTDTSIKVEAGFDEMCTDVQFRLENTGEDDAELYDILVEKK